MTYPRPVTPKRSSSPGISRRHSIPPSNDPQLRESAWQSYQEYVRDNVMSGGYIISWEEFYSEVIRQAELQQGEKKGIIPQIIKKLSNLTKKKEKPLDTRTIVNPHFQSVSLPQNVPLQLNNPAYYSTAPPMVSPLTTIPPGSPRFSSPLRPQPVAYNVYPAAPPPVTWVPTDIPGSPRFSSPMRPIVHEIVPSSPTIPTAGPILHNQFNAPITPLRSNSPIPFSNSSSINPTQLFPNPVPLQSNTPLHTLTPITEYLPTAPPISALAPQNTIPFATTPIFQPQITITDNFHSTETPALYQPMSNVGTNNLRRPSMIGVVGNESNNNIFSNWIPVDFGPGTPKVGSDKPDEITQLKRELDLYRHALEEQSIKHQAELSSAFSQYPPKNEIEELRRQLQATEERTSQLREHLSHANQEIERLYRLQHVGSNQSPPPTTNGNPIQMPNSNFNNNRVLLPTSPPISTVHDPNRRMN